jgi:hypothetical protein
MSTIQEFKQDPLLGLVKADLATAGHRGDNAHQQLSNLPYFSKQGLTQLLVKACH